MTDRTTEPSNEQADLLRNFLVALDKVVVDFMQKHLHLEFIEAALEAEAAVLRRMNK